jgi:hypothetical protein
MNTLPRTLYEFFFKDREKRGRTVLMAFLLSITLFIVILLLTITVVFHLQKTLLEVDSRHWIEFFKGVPFGSLVTVLISTPVAYAIWSFRDQNNRELIENQRKDINLKDFQKLCEWATGQHLLEERLTVGTKITKDGEESSRSVETLQKNTIAYLISPSKREGAVALQVAWRIWSSVSKTNPATLSFFVGGVNGTFA